MINIKNLTVKYDALEVLKDFNYTFEEHEITVLFGPSGCGKTTLLNAVAGLVKYDGDIDASKKISYIFQEDRLLPWMTVYDNVKYVLKNEYTAELLEERVDHYLELVSLKAHKNDLPSKLSGGMKRRISIARAFAYPSDILLMDEPFKGLDKRLKEQIIDDFKRLWHNDRRTVIFVTHDRIEAELLGTKLLELKGLPMEIIHD